MTIRFVPRDRCNALSNTTNKSNDTKTSLIVVKPTTTLYIKQKRERNKHFEFSLERERENENSKSHQTRTSKTVNRSFSLAFFRHKFNTFVPNASASDASFAFDICSLLFYGDDMRAQFSLSRAKAKMFKISNSLFSER